MVSNSSVLLKFLFGLKKNVPTLSECRFEFFIKIPADDLKKVEEFFQILFGLAHLGSPPIIGGPVRSVAVV